MAKSYVKGLIQTSTQPISTCEAGANSAINPTDSLIVIGAILTSFCLRFVSNYFSLLLIVLLIDI